MKHHGYIEHMGEHTYGPSFGDELRACVGCTPRQFYQAIYRLRKKGIIEGPEKGFCGMYSFPETLGQQGIRLAWVNNLQQEMADYQAANEIDGLLRTKQKTDAERSQKF